MDQLKQLAGDLTCPLFLGGKKNEPFESWIIVWTHSHKMEGPME